MLFSTKFCRVEGIVIGKAHRRHEDEDDSVDDHVVCSVYVYCLYSFVSVAYLCFSSISSVSV